MNDCYFIKYEYDYSIDIVSECMSGKYSNVYEINIPFMTDYDSVIDSNDGGDNNSISIGNNNSIGNTINCSNTINNKNNKLLNITKAFISALSANHTLHRHIHAWLYHTNTLSHKIKNRLLLVNNMMVDKILGNAQVIIRVYNRVYVCEGMEWKMWGDVIRRIEWMLVVDEDNYYYVEQKSFNDSNDNDVKENKECVNSKEYNKEYKECVNSNECVSKEKEYIIIKSLTQYKIPYDYLNMIFTNKQVPNYYFYSLIKKNVDVLRVLEIERIVCNNSGIDTIEYNIQSILNYKEESVLVERMPFICRDCFTLTVLVIKNKSVRNRCRNCYVSM